MARVAFTEARVHAEHHCSERVRLRGRVESLAARNSEIEEELRIKDARMERIDARHRPHYPPAERLAILELRAACGWSQEETARRFHVTPLTIHNWMHRLDDDGPDALVQVPVPVSRFPEAVAYIVRRVKALCPRMGTRRIAEMLARASLHLGGTTVRRMLKPKPTPLSPASRRRARSRAVSAKRPNHGWHVDLTIVPTVGGFWVSWCPFPIPQRWPFCWWVAVVVDHFSRRCLGRATFKREPTAREMATFLRRVGRAVGRRPSHLITDHGVQFIGDAFMEWCRRHGIAQRFGAIGRYGSLAVIERFIKSLKNECTRLLPIVPLAHAAFGRELDAFVDWYNAERPHTRLRGTHARRGLLQQVPRVP